MINFLKIAALFLPMVVGGCFIPTMTKHEAFVSKYGGYVGHKVDIFYESGYSQINKAPLQELKNGNKIFIWTLAKRQCVIYYEFDQKTRIIVNWRYEGTDEQCAISNLT